MLNTCRCRLLSVPTEESQRLEVVLYECCGHDRQALGRGLPVGGCLVRGDAIPQQQLRDAHLLFLPAPLLPRTGNT